MKNGKKPYLGGIQEFGAAAYAKDLKAGKLDARAQMGRSVGYDSKSKGYRIYWPGKHSVSVKKNVVFNRSNTKTNKNLTTILGNLLAEGKKNKVIQPSPNSAKTTEKSVDQDNPP